MPFLAVWAITFYVLSLLITDEDLYYKQKEYNNKYSYSSLQVEFSKLDVVAEILPHFILANENERFVPLKFINNTYFKNTTYVQGETTKVMKYSELYFSSDNTTDDLPHLNFNYDYLPAGDSKSSCLHVRVRPKSLPQTSYINYSSLQEMGNWFEARKQYWDSHDPTTGVNLLVSIFIFLAPLCGKSLLLKIKQTEKKELSRTTLAMSTPFSRKFALS